MSPKVKLNHTLISSMVTNTLKYNTINRIKIKRTKPKVWKFKKNQKFKEWKKKYINPIHLRKKYNASKERKFVIACGPHPSTNQHANLQKSRKKAIAPLRAWTSIRLCVWPTKVKSQFFYTKMIFEHKIWTHFLHGWRGTLFFLNFYFF